MGALATAPHPLAATAAAAPGARGLVVFAAAGAPRMRLFCCSFAGGSAAAYAPWRAALAPDVELVAFELPGRGRRFAEPAFDSLTHVARHIVALMQGHTDLPFALYGHSMGAVTALEVSRLLALAGQAPHCLLVSGCAAPHLALKREPKLHDLPRDELIAQLVQLEGLPALLLERPQFIDAFLPTIRADMACRENWRCGPAKLAIPIHALGGALDRLVDSADLAAWQVHTSAAFSLRQFEGGHFFIHSAMRALLAYVSAALARDLAAESMRTPRAQ